MALAFSTYDLERLGAAQRTLLPPFDYESTEAWLLTAVDRIKELVDADAPAISGRTVRHHTEWVMDKLGVHARRESASRME